MPADLRWTDLRLGTACNLACRFCDQAGLRGEADTAAALAALAALPHREGVVLAGGELTTRPDLLELVRGARALGFQRVALMKKLWVSELLLGLGTVDTGSKALIYLLQRLI